MLFEEGAVGTAEGINLNVCIPTMPIWGSEVTVHAGNIQPSYYRMQCHVPYNIITCPTILRSACGQTKNGIDGDREATCMLLQDSQKLPCALSARRRLVRYR